MGTSIALDVLILDSDVQPRETMASATIKEYATLYMQEQALPPIVVFQDGTDYWLADGFHRVQAARQAWLTELPVDMRQGSKRDAILYACGCNKHGKARTNEDKRRIVTRMLQDEAWRKWNDSEIARHCGVGHNLVSKMRKELFPSFLRGKMPTRTVVRNGTVYTMDTSHIGQQSAPAPEPTHDNDEFDDDGDVWPEDEPRLPCRVCQKEVEADSMWHCPNCQDHMPLTREVCATCRHSRPFDYLPGPPPAMLLRDMGEDQLPPWVTIRPDPAYVDEQEDEEEGHDAAAQTGPVPETSLSRVDAVNQQALAEHGEQLRPVVCNTVATPGADTPIPLTTFDTLPERYFAHCPACEVPVLLSRTRSHDHKAYQCTTCGVEYAPRQAPDLIPSWNTEVFPDLGAHPKDHEARRETDATPDDISRKDIERAFPARPAAPALILIPDPPPVVNGKRPTFNRTNEQIDWAKWSWNPVTGCLHNCVYCYARDIAIRYYPEKFEPTFRPDRLKAPQYTFVPAEADEQIGFRNVFVCSMADLFGKWVPQEWIDAILDEVRAAPQWNFLFLTKFPQRLAEIRWPENAWVGTTVDEQYRVDIAEKAFRKVEAPVKWLSCEPLRERLTFSSLDMFDWVVVGGQSKSTQAPAFQPPWEWVEHLWQQARAAACLMYWKPNLHVRPQEYPGNAVQHLYAPPKRD
jgi:protein gp37